MPHPGISPEAPGTTKQAEPDSFRAEPVPGGTSVHGRSVGVDVADWDALFRQALADELGPVAIFRPCLAAQQADAQALHPSFL